MSIKHDGDMKLKHKGDMMKLADLTVDVLTHLYLEEKLTQKQIADRFGTHQARVSALMKRYGVTAVLKSDRTDFPPLTPLQHEVLIGSLMGDGTMSVTGKYTARFAEGHAVLQEEYTRWKAGVLEPFTSSIFPTRKVGEDGQDFHGLTFSTHGCRILRPYYDLFYPEGVRVFPPNLHEQMTPLVLAVWYMDDGSLNRFYPRIAFGLDEQSLLHALRGLRKLGFKPEIHRDPRSETMVSIEFPGQDGVFFDLVRPHIIPSLSYKLPTETPRRDVNRNALVLTPKIASQLYSGGMSALDISRLYGVGTTTVRRRLDEVGHVRQMGRPRKAYDLVAARATLSKYDPSEWSSLRPEVQNQWVEEIIGVLRKSPFPSASIAPEVVLQQFQKVMDVKMVLEDGFIRPWSTIGGVACSSFFPNRYRASYRGRKTAYELWHDDMSLGRAVRFQLQHGDPVPPHRVLRAVTMQSRTPTVFRPTVAKWVYETYCPRGGQVWDPCSGYGGRLMGAVAAGVKYLGTDVEPETVDGNQRLAEVLRATSSCEVVLCPAEEFIPSVEVDLVFTSPPYFDLEHYSKSKDQSYKQYKSYSEWVDGFLRRMVRQAYRSLKIGGYLILNVADKKGHGGVPLVQTTVEVSESEGFTMVTRIEMPLPSLNRGAVSEPVLVFCKKNSP